MDSALAVSWVPIGTVFCSPSNPRLNDEAVPHVAASLRRFGWQQPIVAKPSGEVIAGNTRLKAAQSLGMTEVPVVRFTGTDLEATAFAIADNRTHEFAQWDETALATILQQLRAEDALDGVGYSGSDIDDLLKELGQDTPREVDDPGPEEPPVNPASRRGDLWILGEHRLLCGDSTSADDLSRLMSSETAVLLATDPPYCVDYTGDNRPVHDGKRSGKDWSAVYREVDIRDLGEFLDSVLTACLPRVVPAAPIYVWHAHVQQPVIAAVFEKHALLLHQVLVWVKPCAVFGHSYYQWRHEPCAFGWRRGSKPQHGTGQLNTVWEADWDGKARHTTFHPTSKPTRLFEIPLEQHTRPGDVVLEPFSGSGSQLIAAEKLRRRCRAMELSPAFVDGTVLRWETATGQQARLDGDGRTFAEVRAERLQAATTEARP
jgi:DNA modification methylase